MSSSETTADHEVIKKWDRGPRRPSERGQGDGGQDNDKGGGLLRVDFRDHGDRLDDIDWDEFFKVFDDNDLAFLHQDKTKDGSTSRFNKFIHREDG